MTQERTITYLSLVEELDRDTDRASELAHIGGECATRRKESLQKDPKIEFSNKKELLLSKTQQ